MFWFRRPPYLRWVAAGGLVIVAFLMDLRDATGEPYPFAARDLAAGESIDAAAVEWRRIPAGLLRQPELSGAVAGLDLVAGEPILPAALRAFREIPDDWWAVPLAIPEQAALGSAVRLVVLDPPLVVDGVVVTAGSPGTFGVPEAGLVAVPGTEAVAVAGAAVRGELTVLVEP